MNDEPFIVHLSSFIVCLAACAPAEPPAAHLPRRVVSLAPNVTEIVFALGAGDRLVGTDDFSDEPARAKSLPKVGGVQPDVEKIVALRPDLVIMFSGNNDAHWTLSKSDLRHFYSYPDRNYIQLLDVLSTKAARAATEFGARQLAVAGGVAANSGLRARVQERSPVPVLLPALRYCTDNAAMIAFAAMQKSDGAIDPRRVTARSRIA